MAIKIRNKNNFFNEHFKNVLKKSRLYFFYKMVVIFLKIFLVSGLIFIIYFFNTMAQDWDFSDSRAFVLKIYLAIFIIAAILHFIGIFYRDKAKQKFIDEIVTIYGDVKSITPSENLGQILDSFSFDNIIIDTYKIDSAYNFSNDIEVYFIRGFEITKSVETIFFMNKNTEKQTFKGLFLSIKNKYNVDYISKLDNVPNIKLCSLKTDTNNDNIYILAEFDYKIPKINFCTCNAVKKYIKDYIDLIDIVMNFIGRIPQSSRQNSEKCLNETILHNDKLLGNSLDLFLNHKSFEIFKNNSLIKFSNILCIVALLMMFAMYGYIKYFHVVNYNLYIYIMIGIVIVCFVIAGIINENAYSKNLSMIVDYIGDMRLLDKKSKTCISKNLEKSGFIKEVYSYINNNAAFYVKTKTLEYNMLFFDAVKRMGKNRKYSVYKGIVIEFLKINGANPFQNISCNNPKFKFINGRLLTVYKTDNFISFENSSSSKTMSIWARDTIKLLLFTRAKIENIIENEYINKSN